jgi:beta-lactamase class C
LKFNKHDTVNFSRRGIIAGGLGAALCGPFSASASLIQQSFADVTDAIAASLMSEFRIPGLVIGVTRNGRRSFFSYGVSSRQTGQAATPETRFELGSISKVFTSMAAGLCVTEGRMGWSDPISLYLPELDGTPIGDATLLHLGTYTAGGLPLQFPEAVANETDALEYFRQWTPAARPGEVRQYSNPSIGLLGAAVAAVEGRDFSSALEARLFRPLGLSGAFIDQSGTEDYAWGYNAQDEPVRARPAPFSAQAYGIKSSAIDLVEFLEMNIAPSSAPGNDMMRAINEIQTPRFRTDAFVQNFGWEQYAASAGLDDLLRGNSPSMIFGVQDVREVRGHEAAADPAGSFFNKTGSTNGFGAYVAFVPEQRTGIVILANRNFPIPARVTAAHAILQAVMDNVGP